MTIAVDGTIEQNKGERQVHSKMDEHPYIIKVRPVIKNWELFRKGVSAAGFEMSFVEAPKTPLTALRNMYRNSVTIPVPSHFLHAIGHIESFFLEGEKLCLLVESTNARQSQARIFSKWYPRWKLKLLGERVLSNLIQQYVYLLLISLLHPKDYIVVGETIDPDFAVNVNLRRWSLASVPHRGDSSEEITVISGPQKQEMLVQIHSQGWVAIDLTLLDQDMQKKYSQWIVGNLGTLYLDDINHPIPVVNPGNPLASKRVKG
jgi:hypothetical protein